MVRRNFKDNNRKTKNKQKQRLILIGAEGDNVTERNYFKNFSCHGMKIMMAKGNTTDPAGMVKNIIKTMKKNDINPDYPEVSVYCVFDLDADEKKNIKVQKAENLAKSNGIKLIISNPCFEDWFLCHFEKTTAQMNNKEVMERLKKHIPEYSKNYNIFSLLQRHTNTAIKNAKEQCDYQLIINGVLHDAKSNPFSEVFIVVEKIIQIAENSPVGFS